MKVLVVGSGGREHALCWKIAKSPLVRRLYCAPGNGGTAEVAETLDVRQDDLRELYKFAKQEKVDLEIVLPHHRGKMERKNLAANQRLIIKSSNE